MPNPGYVLLAEDNPADVELAQLALEAEGLGRELVVARDGSEALALLRGKGPRPALAILDLKMPKVGGLEVLAAMRADSALRDIPAVVLTTSDEDRDRSEAERLGAARYFKKPMSFDQLRAIAREMLSLLPP